MASKTQPIQGWRLFLLVTSFLSLLTFGCTSRGAQEALTPTTTDGVDGRTDTGVQGFASVTIAEPGQRRLSRVGIIPRHAILPAGETTVISAIVYDNLGNPVNSRELETRWRMIDQQAGTITTNGVFRAGIHRGVFNQAIEVSVSREVDGRLVAIQTLASVSVIRPLSEQDISRVQVLPVEIQVEPETRVDMAALALDRDGVPVPGVNVSWEVLDTKAGSIDADGRFISGTNVGSFNAAIRVVAQKREDPTQSVAATVSVTVMEPGGAQPPSKVNLYPQEVSLRSGDTIEFRALTLDQRGNLFKDVETSWTLNDPTAGDLDNGGRFRAGLNPGTYPNLVEVTVTPLGVGAPVLLKATATVTVLESLERADTLERLLITPQFLRVRPGESVRLVATALSRSGDTIPSAEVSWSGIEDVVDVSSVGVVTAQDRPGTYTDAVTVEVTAAEGEEKVTLTTSATVIILGPLALVEIVPRQLEVSPKQIIQFTYIAYDIKGVRLFDVSASWEVLDERAGTIDASGLFIAGEMAGEYTDVVKATVRPLRTAVGET